MDRSSIESGSVESLDFDEYQSRLRSPMLDHQNVQHRSSPFQYSQPQRDLYDYDSNDFNPQGSNYSVNDYDTHETPPRSFHILRTSSPLSRITEVGTSSISSHSTRQTFHTAQPRSASSRRSQYISPPNSPPPPPPPRVSPIPVSYHSPSLPTPPTSPNPSSNSRSTRSRVSFSSLPPLPRSPLISQYSSESVQDIPLQHLSSPQLSGGYSAPGRPRNMDDASSSPSSARSRETRARNLPPWLTPVNEGEEPSRAPRPTSHSDTAYPEPRLPVVGSEETLARSENAARPSSLPHYESEDRLNDREQDRYSHPMFDVDANGYSFKDEPVSAEMKEERVRMLEAVFDGTVHSGVDPNGEKRGKGGPLAVFGLTRGTVIFREEGRKLRITVRWFQFLCAWSAATAAVYGAVVSDETSKLGRL